MDIKIKKSIKLKKIRKNQVFQEHAKKMNHGNI